MAETLYIKIDRNVQIHDAKIYLKDIAQIVCSSRETGNRIKTMTVLDIAGKRPGRYVCSVMEVIEQIQREFPALQINNLGEADFIITYEKQNQPDLAVSVLKTAAVCILSFFGAAFSIMAFHNDVDITGLFAQLYLLFTGQTSDGFTVLELSYSFGLAAGILVFFNHFAGKKEMADPTPLEVQMRTYEDDVNAALIEAGRRKPEKERRKTI